MRAATIDQVALRESLHSAYASGELDGPMRLLVETQAALCAEAEADLLLSEALAGAFFEEEAESNMAPGAFERVVERVKSGDDAVMEQERPTLRAARVASNVIDEILGLPVNLRDLALESIGAGGWTFAGPGLRSLPLKLPGCGGVSKAELLRIEPGWGAPRHGHQGGEYTLVLSGSFSDERGRYRPGQIAVGGPSLTHRPVADPGEVCYSLAVTDAPLAFTGALGLLQKLWRH